MTEEKLAGRCSLALVLAMFLASSRPVALESYVQELGTVLEKFLASGSAKVSARSLLPKCSPPNGATMGLGGPS